MTGRRHIVLRVALFCPCARRGLAVQFSYFFSLGPVGPAFNSSAFMLPSLFDALSRSPTHA